MEQPIWDALNQMGKQTSDQITEVFRLLADIQARIKAIERRLDRLECML